MYDELLIDLNSHPVNHLSHTTHLQLSTLKSDGEKQRKYLDMKVSFCVLTMWRKEKLLFMSNFSFCHNDFKSRLLQRRRHILSVCGERITPKTHSCIFRSVVHINSVLL